MKRKKKNPLILMMLIIHFFMINVLEKTDYLQKQHMEHKTKYTQ